MRKRVASARNFEPDWALQDWSGLGHELVEPGDGVVDVCGDCAASRPVSGRGAGSTRMIRGDQARRQLRSSAP